MSLSRRFARAQRPATGSGPTQRYRPRQARSPPLVLPQASHPVHHLTPNLLLPLTSSACVARSYALRPISLGVWWRFRKERQTSWALQGQLMAKRTLNVERPFGRDCLTAHPHCSRCASVPWVPVCHPCDSSPLWGLGRRALSPSPACDSLRSAQSPPRPPSLSQALCPFFRYRSLPHVPTPRHPRPSHLSHVAHRTSSSSRSHSLSPLVLETLHDSVPCFLKTAASCHWPSFLPSSCEYIPAYCLSHANVDFPSASPSSPGASSPLAWAVQSPRPCPSCGRWSFSVLAQAQDVIIV